MKRTIYFIFILFLISCSKPIPSYTSNIEFINTTNRSIEIIVFNNGKMSDKVYLVDNSKKTFYYYTQKEWIQPPPFMGDSAIVIFRDTTMISHSQMDLSHPKRNLFKTSIWNLRKDGDNDYHYTYSFDNEDYREALEAI